MKTVFINGNIFTAKDTQTFVQSMMVEDGKIIWTGMESELPQAMIAETNSGALRYVDLKEKTVIPGFVDAHMHPVMLAEYSKQIACLPPTVNSIADLVGEIAKVREEILASAPLSVSPKDDTQTESTPLTDADALPWIRGWGYDEGKYAEKRSPNRYDLDKGSPDLPVFLVRSCEHIRCVNSKALEIAGITKDTPDPPGGAIDRDENGEPTGVLRENARDLVLPFMPEDTKEELIDALVDLSQLLTSQGIVGVADMGNLHPGGNYELYEAAAKKGFKQRVALYYMWDYFKDDPTFADYLIEPKGGDTAQGSVPSKPCDANQKSEPSKPDDVCQGSMPPKMDYNNRIRITGLKLIGDGSISGRTAWMNQPFLDGESGMPVYSDKDFESALAFAKKTGCQLSVHAMGGRAIDRVVSRMQPEEDWISEKPFADFPVLRVEHLTEPSDSAMKIAAEKGFAFITQPIFEYCEIETYKANMDPERLRHIYPSRTMLERGISLAFSTDAPATSWAVPSDPFPNLKSAVTRKSYDGTDIGWGDSARDDSAVGASSGNDCKDNDLPGTRSDWGERVDVAMAILLYTKKAAAVCGFAGLGQLVPGYSADFAVLSDDIFTADPDSIDQIYVEQTYINGQCVYRR